MPAVKRARRTGATIERNKAKDEAMNAEANESPRDYMLRVMRDPAADIARRDAMARACAPYVHAQLQAVAHQHLDDKGRPIVPQINVQIMQTPVDAPKL